MNTQNYMEAGYIPITRGMLPENDNQLGQIPVIQGETQTEKNDRTEKIATIAKLAPLFML